MALVALWLMAATALFLYVGVGLGSMRLLREELYHAGDMAALAGVHELDFAQLLEGRLVLEKGRAETTAREFLERNLQPLASRLADTPANIAYAGTQVIALNPGEVNPWTGRSAALPTVWLRIQAPVRTAAGAHAMTVEVQAVAHPPGGSP